MNYEILLTENKETADNPSSEREAGNRVSRRDFLKYGVGVTAVAVGATALMGKIPFPASETRQAAPPALSTSDPIIVAVHGDELTVMKGNQEVTLKDSGLAGVIASIVR